MFSIFNNKKKLNDKKIKKIIPIVDTINNYENNFSKLSDLELANKTFEFKDALKNGKTLENILPEAFATVREASKRVLGMRHFDVQLIGGINIHNGNISQMQTGEGKTLTSTLPVYLNSLLGDGVHIVSVNDYLTKRDFETTKPLYDFLNISCGYIISTTEDEERKNAYNADITYATNNELGFDFLRDNLKPSLELMCQRQHNFVIIDEVDSILIDEARTPLIISGNAQDDSQSYKIANNLFKKFPVSLVELDEKNKSINVSEKGLEKIEEILIDNNFIKPGEMYNTENIAMLHIINQVICAHNMYTREKDYIVEGGEIIIIDEFTGRKMHGRRYSNGLHQAIEAKESVKIKRESQTLASITFQNYFRMYKKIAGMTGTASTEAEEFKQIYNLDILDIPTNLPSKRIDTEDAIYFNQEIKDKEIINTIKSAYEKGQPVLVGTASIDMSEHYSNLLTKNKIKHNLLNAKNHAKEAEIISNAGAYKAVTIATNMAGRGTDIKLGGANATADEKQKIIDIGGLRIVGTQRHESRRIDNQLRGRCGRQGDPGITTFFISLDDDLMRIFGSDKMSSMLTKLGLDINETITHPWITRAIEKAQQKVEEHNFEIRKQLIKFDDITNDQRKTMFSLRKKLLDPNYDIVNATEEIRTDVIGDIVSCAIAQNSLIDNWDFELIDNKAYEFLNLTVDMEKFAHQDGVDDQQIYDYLNLENKKLIDDKFLKDLNQEEVGKIYSKISIDVLDECWKKHLSNMDELKEGIGLRSYGQKDPLNEYRLEGFKLFEEFLKNYNELFIRTISHIELKVHSDEEQKKLISEISRNAICPLCKSGLKYKHCCGKFK